jgi:mRNA-degrading endonuclease RelE of RelBE toxin-antitoxin system
MNYKILPTKEFEKDFNKLDSHFQKEIKKKLEEVA